ncbi:MAG: nucleotidyltransferase domain-containing protein [Candidatus Omnitrophota bacterium]
MKNDKNSKKHVNDIKDFVLDFFKKDDIKIFLFGSRARGDANLYSDIDIGIIPGKNFDRSKITMLRGKIEDLNIPNKIEIVNFSEVSAEFKQEALKGAVIWKD